MTPLLRFAALLFLGASYAANGVLMLLWSDAWYGCLVGGTAAATSGHFIRDTGAAYLVVGIGLVVAGWKPLHAHALTLVALGFSALHALTHVRDYLVAGLPTRSGLIEAVGVWAPLLLLLWLAAGTAPRRSLR